MATHRYCDGIRRRDFVRVGLLGGVGFSLADYLRLAEAGKVTSAKATAAIFVNLAGGPSHLDSFDPKPEAPVEYRGEFKPIARFGHAMLCMLLQLFWEMQSIFCLVIRESRGVGKTSVIAIWQNRIIVNVFR